MIADSDLLSFWTIGLVLAVVVVVVVVALLLAILVTARRILQAAARALQAAERIRGNTMPLWDLTTTNQVASDLRAGARSIRRHADAIAAALEATEHEEVRR